MQVNKKITKFSNFVGHKIFNYNILKSKNIHRFILFKFEKIKQKSVKNKEKIWSQTKALQSVILHRNLCKITFSWKKVLEGGGRGLN